jgi:glycosyltransferase involved in cell wall biosynthesis
VLDLVDVVVRCRNEMPHTPRSLDALAGQRAPAARVLFIDCASTDGSREEAVATGVPLVDWSPDAYRPGAVINAGMERTTSSVVAFVNADAVARGPDALARLIIFHLGAPSPIADLARPLAGSLLRDARARDLTLRGALTRGAQAVGYFVGRAEAAWTRRA